MNTALPLLPASFKSFQRSHSCLWLLMASLLGCHTEQSVHEAEHIIPAHKPRDFRDCVARLQALRGEFAEQKLRPDSEIDADTELADLIRWLPEFATDSELDETSWNRVVELSQEMHSLVAPVSHLTPQQQSTVAVHLESSLKKPLTELQELAASLPYYPRDDAVKNE